MNDISEICVRDDIYDGLIEKVYVFSEENTPSGIKYIFDDLHDYSAAVVYEYVDHTWGLAYSVKGINDPSYEESCDYVEEDLGEIADKNCIDILFDDDIDDVDLFIPQNLHHFYFA